MGKKKKRQKLFSVFAVIEGEKREANFLLHLKEIYLDAARVKFIEHPIHGGSPDRLLEQALKCLYFAYDRIFVWIDEDVDLSENSREVLFKEWKIDNKFKQEFIKCPLGRLQEKYNINKQNPILIVSQPVSVEAIILKTLGKNMPFSCEEFNSKERKKQINDLKSCLNSVFNGMEEREYYKNNLTKDILEEKRKNIAELDLLISMIIHPKSNH